MEHVIVGSLFVIIIVTAGWLIGFYNKMINKKEQVDNSWSLLIYQLQTRNELLKEYLDTSFSGYFNPELDYLKQLIHERGSNLAEGTPCDAISFSLEISKHLEKLKAAQCPGIDENSRAVQMMHQLTELGVRIEKCRELYNEKVHNYNMFLSKFPNNIGCQIIGVQKLPWLNPSESRGICNIEASREERG